MGEGVYINKDLSQPLPEGKKGGRKKKRPKPHHLRPKGLVGLECISAPLSANDGISNQNRSPAGPCVPVGRRRDMAVICGILQARAPGQFVRGVE